MTVYIQKAIGGPNAGDTVAASSEHEPSCFKFAGRIIDHTYRATENYTLRRIGFVGPVQIIYYAHSSLSDMEAIQELFDNYAPERKVKE